MASIDEMIRMDEEENLRELAFIRQQISSEMKEFYSDSDILYILDTIVDYYYTSGILESTEDEIDIDMEKVAEYVCQRGKKDRAYAFNPEDMLLIVQADLDFQEQNLW